MRAWYAITSSNARSPSSIPSARAASVMPVRQSRTVPKMSNVKIDGADMIRSSPRWIAERPSVAGRLELHVGLGPCLPEPVLDGRSLARLLLRAKRLRETVERPSILGIAREILPIYRLRLGGAIRGEEHGAERLARRLLPRRRLVVPERILLLRRLAEEPDRLVGAPRVE